jgi:hypothetical protein
MLLKCSGRAEQRGDMIDVSDSERRQAFSMWLRTGRLPSAKNVDGIELKFNPWHDPENGRFTFVGAGRRHGGGGASGSGDRDARPFQPKPRSPAGGIHAKEPKQTPSPDNRAASSRPSTRRPPPHGSWNGGGFTGGGGGSFGGGGATTAEAWGSSEPKHRPTTSQSQPAPIGSADGVAATSRSYPRPAGAPIEPFRTVVSNGYTYQIDSRGRTRRVSGTLTDAKVPVRSRTSQSQAGGAERRANDDGGHYIAARFNGPTEAFNHFVQDSNFNRGSYRLLEDEWARDKRAGRTVTVEIVPQFSGNSVRPSMIDVWWTVDGQKKSLKFPNERSEKRRGRN